MYLSLPSFDSLSRGRALRWSPVILLLAFSLALTGCDETSPVSSETTADRSVSSQLDASAPSATPSATELPTAQSEAEPIPGQYIVQLDETAVTAKSKAAVRSLALSMLNEVPGKSSSRLLRTYSSAVSGFAATDLSKSQAQSLRSDPRVLHVEQDQRVYALATQSPTTWGLDRVDARLGLNDAYSFSEDATGVTAYIIDTGIRTSHNDFGGRAVAGFDAFNDGRNGQDCNGHGTHVAGTVGGSTYGVAKDVSLVGVRVLDCRGGGSTSGVIAGVDWVAQNAAFPAVANMSLGGGLSTTLDNAVQNAINAGIPFAVAAGNSNANACNASPARVDDALTVGASTSNDARSSFSNYGSCVDLFAPGSNIASTWIGSDSDVNTISGTSMASPHVAGVAALYLAQNPGASSAQVFNAVLGTTTLNAVTDVNGSPNRLLFSGLNTSGRDVTSGGGGTTAPCSNCDLYSGSLSSSSDYDIQPEGSYYASNGADTGYLQGPDNADFDLYLYRWSGYGWNLVASSAEAGSEEQISFDGSSGYYYWRVDSYSGGGSYEFYLE